MLNGMSDLGKVIHILEERIDALSRPPPIPPNKPPQAFGNPPIMKFTPGSRTNPAAPVVPTTPPPDDGHFPAYARPSRVIGTDLRPENFEQNTGRRSFASMAAAAQNRTPAGAPARNTPRSAPALSPNTTEVTIIRNGGFVDKTEEAKLRARSPAAITSEVRDALSRVSGGIHVLHGRWSANYRYTGNFIFTMSGNVPDDAVTSISSILCGPFKGGVVVPNKGWLWLHLRGVPTRGPTGLWTEEELTYELRLNPLFNRAFICVAPFWQTAPERIRTETSTVIVAVADASGSIKSALASQPVFLFGYQCKTVPVRDGPNLIQCGRCHMIGHNASNRTVCPVPVTEARCARCGGPHPRWCGAPIPLDLYKIGSNQKSVKSGAIHACIHDNYEPHQTPMPGRARSRYSEKLGEGDTVSRDSNYSLVV